MELLKEIGDLLVAVYDAVVATAQLAWPEDPETQGFYLGMLVMLAIWKRHIILDLIEEKITILRIGDGLGFMRRKTGEGMRKVMDGLRLVKHHTIDRVIGWGRAIKDFILRRK